MNKLFDFLEKCTNDNLKKKYYHLFYIVFAPISLLLESICYWFFWRHICLVEIFTNDEIVDFLDKNEFGYKWNKIYKSDILDDKPFYAEKNLDESKHMLKAEFVKSFAEIFEENIPFKIEDYVTLTVNTELKTVFDNGERFRSKVYNVKLFYCRDFYFNKCMKLTIKWLIIILLILICYFYFGSDVLSNHLIIK